MITQTDFAHLQRCVELAAEALEAADAEVVEQPVTFPYGERQYSVRDPGGHVWTFSETVQDVDPDEWGGELVG